MKPIEDVTDEDEQYIMDKMQDRGIKDKIFFNDNQIFQTKQFYDIVKEIENKQPECNAYIDPLSDNDFNIIQDSFDKDIFQIYKYMYFKYRNGQIMDKQKYIQDANQINNNLEYNNINKKEGQQVAIKQNTKFTFSDQKQDQYKFSNMNKLTFQMLDQYLSHLKVQQDEKDLILYGCKDDIQYAKVCVAGMNIMI